MLSQKQSHRNSQSFDSEDVDNESQPLQVIVSMGNHFTPPKLDQSPVVPSDAHNPDPVNVELQTSTQTATKVQAQTSDEISPNVIPAPTLDKQEGLLNDDKPAEVQEAASITKKAKKKKAESSKLAVAEQYGLANKSSSSKDSIAILADQCVGKMRKKLASTKDVKSNSSTIKLK